MKYDPKKKYTYGELYGPAMKIKNRPDARLYFEALVMYSLQEEGLTIDEKEVRQNIKDNLGYYAGYYDDETRLRVEEIFECAHPMFGKAKDGSPSIEEAFKRGMDFAERGNVPELD